MASISALSWPRYKLLRTPQPQQLTLRGQVTRPCSLAGADVVDRLLRRPVRNMSCHRDEVLDGDPPSLSRLRPDCARSGVFELGHARLPEDGCHLRSAR